VPKAIFTPARTALVKLRLWISRDFDRVPKNRWNAVIFAGRLNALVVINVHIQVCAVLFASAMPSSSINVACSTEQLCADRILDSFWGVRVRSYT